MKAERMRNGRLEPHAEDEHSYNEPGVAPEGSAAKSRCQPPGSLGGSNRLLTVVEVAEYLGVPKKTVYECWRSWGLRAYKVGRHLRFRERDIGVWLERREV